MMKSPLLLWRERLSERHLSTVGQREAAQMLGCSPASYNRWENGAQEPPRYILLAAAALEARLRPLGEDRDDPQPPDI